MSKYHKQTWHTIFTNVAKQANQTKPTAVAKPSPPKLKKDSQLLVDFLSADNGYIERTILELHQLIDSTTKIKFGMIPENKDANGCWNRMTDEIKIISKGINRSVIIHEAIHPLCYEAIDEEMAAWITDTANQYSIYMACDSRGQYGDTSLCEFVCEFLSNDIYAEEIACRNNCRISKTWIALRREEMLDMLRSKLTEKFAA